MEFILFYFGYNFREKEDFEYRDYNITVALKQLKGSENITFRELNEVYCFNLINDIAF